MRSSKLGLRTLGLSLLAAVGMMAFAVNAQAQLPGESTLGSFQINKAGALLATIKGTQTGAGKLLVQGRNLTIECQSGKVTSGKITGATHAVGTALFEACVAWNFNQTTKLPCTVLTPGEPTGSAAAEGLVLPILHGGVNYVLFEATGLNFTELELHGATCPLPLVNPVKGSITAEVTNNHSVTPSITFSPAIQLLTGDQLTFGGFASYIDASATVELTGVEHAGDTLGVL